MTKIVHIYGRAKATNMVHLSTMHKFSYFLIVITECSINTISFTNLTLRGELLCVLIDNIVSTGKHLKLYT